MTVLCYLIFLRVVLAMNGEIAHIGFGLFFCYVHSQKYEPVLGILSINFCCEVCLPYCISLPMQVCEEYSTSFP